MHRLVWDRRRLIGLIMAAVLLMALAACAGGQREPDTCDALPNVLFFDDFNGEQDCGWATYNRNGSVAAIENASMRLTVSQPGQLWWTNPNRVFDDVVISAEARQVSGPNDNAYGLICRYQNEQNFYVFLISGDGYYAIGKYQSGSETVQYLTPDGQFQESAAINTGVATNELLVTCIGNELTLQVNGVPLVTVTDTTFQEGDIGVAASTLQAQTSVVEFDNVQVTLP